MKILHSSNTLKTSLAVLIGALLLGGCATTVNPTSTTVSKVDPYENVNRDIFTFNDTVDSYVAKPISDAYKWVTPQFAQTGIFNFFNNLKNVNVVINDVLQGKFEQSAEDTGRLLINTTAGLGGLIDVAQEVGLKQNDEDFDQTLAVWGVPTGPYMVLPLLGPTTLRGIPGAIFDTAANPSSYVGMPVQLVSLLNTRANAQSSLDMVKEGALDPYVFIREGYIQSREHLASDGKKQVHTDVDDLGLDNDLSTKAPTTNRSATTAAATNSSSTASGSSKSTPSKHKLELSFADDEDINRHKNQSAK
jgi:phospholipid-binding lipoprotein MlaA